MITIFVLSLVVSFGFFLLNKLYIFADSPATLMLIDSTKGFFHKEISEYQVYLAHTWVTCVLFFICICLLLILVRAGLLAEKIRNKQDVCDGLINLMFFIFSSSSAIFYFTSKENLIFTAIIKQGSNALTLIKYNSHVISEYTLQLSQEITFLFIVLLVIRVFLPNDTERKI